MANLGMITLLVDDYDQAINYYTNVLGFTLVEDTPLSDIKRWVVLSPGEGAHLLLAKAANEVQAAAIGNQTGGRVSFFLYTDNFDRDYARLSEHNVAFIESPRFETFGKVVVFADKYGNKWDFIEMNS